MAYSLAITQAISIMIYISIKMHNGQYEYLSTKYISEKLEIPAPSVTKILKYLLMSGLIVTKEGASGGILLAKDPKEITFLDIFIAIENKKPLFKVSHTNSQNDKIETIKNHTMEVFREAEYAMKNTLENTTLFDIVNKSN